MFREALPDFERVFFCNQIPNSFSFNCISAPVNLSQFAYSIFSQFGFHVLLAFSFGLSEKIISSCNSGLITVDQLYLVFFLQILQLFFNIQLDFHFIRQRNTSIQIKKKTEISVFFSFPKRFHLLRSPIPAHQPVFFCYFLSIFFQQSG